MQKHLESCQLLFLDNAWNKNIQSDQKKGIQVWKMCDIDEFIWVWHLSKSMIQRSWRVD